MPTFQSNIDFKVRPMNEIESHPFEPFIPHNASVLIVGSFPGKEHTTNGAGNGQWFYGAKRNQFWKILSSVYDVPLETTESKKQLFEKKGIAIADFFLKVRRKDGGNLDNNLEIVEYNDKSIEAILASRQFSSICLRANSFKRNF